MQLVLQQKGELSRVGEGETLSGSGEAFLWPHCELGKRWRRKEAASGTSSPPEPNHNTGKLAESAQWNKMKHFETNESREWEVKLYHVVKVRLLRLGLGLSIPGPEQMGPKGPRDLSSQACRLRRTRMG